MKMTPLVWLLGNYLTRAVTLAFVEVRDRLAIFPCL